MISVLIPTRKRRAGLLRAAESIRATQTSTVEIVAYVDDDDDSYADFGSDVKFVKGPRIVLSNMWNKCAAAASGDIFCQGNDDIVFRTPGWDRMVEEEFAKWPDRIVVVHGNDGSKGHASSDGGFGPHPFVSREWYETLGYVTAPYFSSDYGDTWIADLANGIERRRYIPFVIEHMHMIFGKAESDQTTSDRLNRHSADNVEFLYRCLEPLRAIDIEKLKRRCHGT